MEKTETVFGDPNKSEQNIVYNLSLKRGKGREGFDKYQTFFLKESLKPAKLHALLS